MKNILQIQSKKIPPLSGIDNYSYISFYFLATLGGPSRVIAHLKPMSAFASR
jgi:hypothetical protein